MSKSFALALVLANLLLLPTIKAASPVYKCSSNSGAITYQDDPCPPGKPMQRPTIAQLNAERQKRLQQAAAAAQNQPAPITGVIAGFPIPTDRGLRAAPTGSPALSFHCDGRRYCSQMTSCAEAKRFLAHCPGVEMDGDGDGIPCEQQWCSR